MGALVSHHGLGSTASALLMGSHIKARQFLADLCVSRYCAMKSLHYVVTHFNLPLPLGLQELLYLTAHISFGAFIYFLPLLDK